MSEQWRLINCRTEERRKRGRRRGGAKPFIFQPYPKKFKGGGVQGKK